MADKSPLPEEVQKSESETPAQAEEKAQEETQREEDVKAGEDRSAFNCPDCAGEGLKDQGTLCPRCGGTGKV